MKMKKSLGLILAVAMTVGIMTGCGNKADKQTSTEPKETAVTAENSPEVSTEVTGDPLTITFGFWGDTAEAQMKMDLAEAYMKENPNVKIEFEYTDGAGYLTKMQTWFSSDTVPDVFGLASDALYQFKGNKLFEDLAPYVEKDELGKLWNMEVANSTYGDETGKLYAVPFISKVFGIAYNKDLFDQAKIEYPTDDWTEEDMLKAAEAISALSTDNQKVYGLRWGVRAPEFYRNLYGNMIYDVDTLNVNVQDNAEFKHAVSLFGDTIKAGLAPDETAAAVSTGGFETGMFGMQLSATWDIATFQSMIGDTFAWDVAMLPNNTEFNTRMLSTLRGNGWCMSSTAKEKEACWDFIKYMSATEEAAIQAQNYGIPALESYAQSDEYMNNFGDGTAYDKGAFIRMQEYTTNFYNLGAFAEVNDAIKAEYELYVAGKNSLDVMLINCQEQGEAIMSSYK